MGVRGERAAFYRTGDENRGGGERGLMNRDSSREFVRCTGRNTSSATRARFTSGSKNAPVINAGRAGSWQQDMEHGIVPPKALLSCPQSVGDDCCSGADCCLG